MNAYIYHFSANTEATACKKDMQALARLAKTYGFTEPQIFLDNSLKTGEQEQFEHMIKKLLAEKDDTYLFLMDLYHFNKRVQKTIDEVSKLCKNRVKVITKRDGFIKIDDGLDMLKEPHKAAFYFSNLTGLKERMMETQLRIAEVFCKEKTNWEITGIYHDYAENRGVKMQPELERLIAARDEYDVLIVGSLQHIDQRTARFVKLRNQLNLDIYSMQDGMLYRKGGD